MAQVHALGGCHSRPADRRHWHRRRISRDWILAIVRRVTACSRCWLAEVRSSLTTGSSNTGSATIRCELVASAISATATLRKPSTSTSKTRTSGAISLPHPSTSTSRRARNPCFRRSTPSRLRLSGGNVLSLNRYAETRSACVNFGFSESGPTVLRSGHAPFMRIAPVSTACPRGSEVFALRCKTSHAGAFRLGASRMPAGCWRASPQVAES